MNLKELQDVLEKDDDVLVAHKDGCFTKLDKDQLLLCIKFTLGFNISERKFTQEEIDAMDNAPTIPIGDLIKDV